MKWIKKGLLIKPGKFEWMATHAQNPFPEQIKGDKYKIHFAGRDKNNMSRGGYALVDFRNPKDTIRILEQPYLTLGELGAFDDCGVMPSCIVNHENSQYMYYTGWSQARSTPFTFYIGLSISEDNGGTFKRYSRAPVLGRTYHDPFLTGSPWVIIEDNIWKMWYVSATKWVFDEENHQLKHFYHIKYTESMDGINWKSEGKICIDFKDDIYAIARPSLIKEDGIYKMLYSYRGGWERYRIGYAESEDGISWERKDSEVGIDISESGWDSEMVCYGCVFKNAGKKYVLYNGNNYGSSGCGYAVLDEE